MTNTERALKLRPIMEQAAQSLEDSVALTAKELYPTWKKLCETNFTAENKGYRFRYDKDLWRTEQARYTFVEHYVPGEGTESLFSKVDENHAGTINDPIPYSKNMEIFLGKYYTQDNVLYRCIRSSEQPLYHNLSDLVGSYVEVVT